MERICQAGGFFSRCKNASSWMCQFCGRRFCETHTGRVQDHEEICSREICRQKDADLAVHVEYRARVSQRNGAGLCGFEGCEARSMFQCSLCRGAFCDPHLKDRRYRFSEGWTTVERPVSICSHCWDRRKIWTQRR
ncbi:MAG: hypothetical protein ACSLFM_03110 [Tepidiformaceae bacterium]